MRPGGPSASIQAASRASSLPQEPCPCSRRGVFLWERPWPRRGFRCPQASIQAAIASKLAPTETLPMLPTRRVLVGAALAATGLSLSAGFDSGRCREQARSHRNLARAADAACSCGSGPGRDGAFAVRRLRFRPLSRASSLPQKPCPCCRRGVFLWERPWPRRGFRCPQASIQAAVASKLAPTGTLPVQPTRRVLVGAALAETGLSLSAGFDSGRYREQARSHRSLAA